MYEFKHVSPSQIETWLGCNRQWYWQYPMGIKSPPTASTLLGSACHTIAEDFIQEQNGEDLSVKRDGKDHYRAVVRPAMATLRMLGDLHKSGLGHVERSMKRKLRNGLDLIGRIDFLSLPETDNPLVVDHKTSSNLKYAKTEEEMATNIQMLAYAYEAVCLKPLAKGVRVAHNVMLTRGAPAARYTDVFIPTKDIHAGWTLIQNISDQMIKTSKIASPADVPPNLSACDRFGGCFHRDRCAAIKNAQNPNTSPYDGIDAASASTQENTVTTALPAHLLAKLGVKIPNTTPVPTVGGVAPAAPARPALPAALSGLLPPEAPMNPRDAKVQAAALAAATPTPAPAAAAAPGPDGAALLQSLGWSNEEIDAMTERVFEETVAQGAKREDCEIGFAAPEADGFQAIDRVSPTATKIREIPAAPARRSRTAAPAPVADTVALVTGEQLTAALEANDTATVQAVAASQEAAAPKRRGRPPGAKNKPKDGEVIDEDKARAEMLMDAAHQNGETPASHYIGGESTLVDDAPAAPVAGLLDEALARIAELEQVIIDREKRVDDLRAAAPSPPTYGEFVLYIDCLPETPGVAFRHLDTVLAPFMDLVAKGFKNEKTGAPEPLSHYALVPFARGPSLVAAHVLTNLASVTAPGILYVDTRSPCAAAVLEVLRPKADLIVSARGR